MPVVPLEYFEDFAGELSIESSTTQLALTYLCFFKVLIVKVVEAAIF